GHACTEVLHGFKVWESGRNRYKIVPVPLPSRPFEETADTDNRVFASFSVSLFTSHELSIVLSLRPQLPYAPNVIGDLGRSIRTSVSKSSDTDLAHFTTRKLTYQHGSKMADEAGDQADDERP